MAVSTKCGFCGEYFVMRKETSRCCSKSCATSLRHKDPTCKIGFPAQKRLSGNPSWKGDRVGYRGIHSWVVRNWGKADRCEQCQTNTSTRYDWSNKTGLLIRNRDNWQRLCRSCHLRYDYAHGMRKTRKPCV